MDTLGTAPTAYLLESGPLRVVTTEAAAALEALKVYVNDLVAI